MALSKMAGWPGVATLAHAPGASMFVGEHLRHQRSRLWAGLARLPVSDEEQEGS
jgi:hypothetical protein